ncbi:tripartite tricarboxylate transporter substrate binding protein [Caenimonas aquaedulcis]|uniref:Tripartite tricarboxylate transporter substrate binding protein n=1 Tax=Caenimonas aquaedulcis TaxID=2793270 RepID=A0A931H4F8_9BURK|nr:tripartite tricarboxylate transporter substrate binding protein [Caenimonas aquaedulcis]MBG9388391.1 tripartite tricarboxylate transporter substrate binding protein [Caenimonas aquaedulcis]
MRIRLRRIVRAIAAAALIAAACSAAAQAPIRIVVPTTAGGPLDVVGRVLATGLSRDLKETVIVDNRPGANAIIGTEYVVRAPSDGRTLLLGSGFVATNAVLNKLSFDPARDLAPVAELTRAGMVVLVRKGLPVSGPRDLAGAAAAQPGGLNCAAPPGEMGLGCEQLRQALGGAVVTVPYPGVAPAIQALVGGHADVMLAPYDAALPFLDGGRVVPIATSGTTPVMAPFERLPLLKEQWPGFVVVGFLGVFAPAGTPAETIRRLNREFASLLKDPPVREFMRARGSSADEVGPPEKLAATLADRLDYYRRLADAIGLKPQ